MLIIDGVMQPLNLPGADFRIREENGKTQIFDPVRRKFVVITPEEWVRQHMIFVLASIKKVPFSLIGVETKLLVNNLVRRFDVCVFNRRGEPVMLVECKAPSVALSEQTFDQVARYNLPMNVKYLVVTNGLETYSCRIDYQNRTYHFLKDLPEFETMIE